MKNTYNRAKKIGVGFLDWVEVGLGGSMYRIQLNRDLTKRMTAHGLAMPKEFKEQVRDYWQYYTTKFDMRWQYYFSQRNGQLDPRHIPEDLHFTVFDRAFNNRALGRGISDKNYIPLLFPEISQPRNLARRINGVWMDGDFNLISQAYVQSLCLDEQAVIIKPSIGTGGGAGIQFWNQDDGKAALASILDDLGKNVVVQAFMGQHKNMAALHPSSVNTIRAVTFYFQGQVHLLSAVVRMGKDGGRMDNGCAGGLNAGIQADGRLKKRGFNLMGDQFQCHPTSGASFEDCLIPNYSDVVDLVTRSHNKLLHSKLVTWDIAIGEDGSPVMIEFNLFCGGIAPHQLNNGPLFGDLTEDVLKAVFKQ